MSDPASIGSRGRKIDDIEDEIVNGPKSKAKPAYSRAPTPERNDSYSDMEKRIYGDKSAKAKK